MLDCNKNGSLASKKNLVLTDVEGDEDYMLLGKVCKDRYRMSVRWPLSPYQAFAIALSTVEHSPLYM